MGKIDKKLFISSAIWKMVETISVKGVSTIISIILARILVPEDYGIIALTSIFISFSGMVMTGGMDTSLIQKKEVDDLDYSNALFYCVGIATILYIVFWFVAPYIAILYKEDSLTAVLRIQMLSLFIGAFAVVRNAMIVKRFQFKKLCLVNCLATVVGGVIGIVLAYTGFGVWALVVYTLVRDLLSTVILLIVVRWRIVFKISIERMKKLVTYSRWVLCGNVTDFLGNNVYSTVFGKRYSVTQLGYYGKGNQLPELVCLNTFGAVASVLLPTLSAEQENKERAKQIVRKMVRVSTYVIFPMMTGLAVIGERLIPFLFTEKWLPSVPFLWAACIQYGINPLRQINMQLIYAFGDSRKGTVIECIRFLLLMINLIITIVFLKLDILQVVFSMIGVAFIIVFLTQCFARKLINYRFVEWFLDIAPAAIFSFIMFGVIYVGKLLPFNDVVGMFVQIILGVATYLILSNLFKNESFMELLQLIKGEKND